MGRILVYVDMRRLHDKRTAPPWVPLTYNGIYSLVMLFLVVLVLASRWIFFPFWETLPGPYIAVPPIYGRGWHIEYNRFATGPSDFHVIVVSIDRRGRIFIDKRVIITGRLVDEIQSEIAQVGRPVIYVKADKTTPYSSVLQLLRILKSLGIERINLVVDGRGGNF